MLCPLPPGEANTAPSACELPDGDWLRSLSKAQCLSSLAAGADGGEMGYSVSINEPKGAVWYAKQFPRMVQSYREHFQNPKMKFIWVNLQAYNDGHTGIADGKWCKTKHDCWKDCATKGVCDHSRRIPIITRGGGRFTDHQEIGLGQ